MLMEAIRDREQDFPTIAKLSQQDIEKIYNTFLNTLEE